MMILHHVVTFTLLGCAATSVQKLKLERISFDQQLATHQVRDHTRALAYKYDQRILSTLATEILGSESAEVYRRCELPIENLWNGECMDV